MQWRKRIGALCVLVLMLFAATLAGAAETSFTMAGYDPEDTGHVWDDNLFFQRRESQSGIHFTFSQFTDSEEWHRTLAGYTEQTIPDVLFKADLTVSETLSLYKKGLLIDLRPYLSEAMPNLSALLEAHPDWLSAISLPDGAIVALPTINPLQSNNIIWVNRTWLNRLGLEMPETAEAFADMLRAMKTGDPNRNGRADEIPLTFTGMWDLRYLAHAFGLIGNDYYLEVQDGNVVCDLYQEQYPAFIQWLHTLWEEKLIDHNGFSSLDTTRQITDTNATITYGVVFGPTALNMVPSSAIGDYEVLMPMQYEGKRVYRSLLGDVARGTCAVSCACKDPATVLSWIDYLYSEEGCFLACAGLDGDEYERTSDGAWYWVDDIQTVQDSVLKDATIADGTALPIYMPVSYQLQFDDTATRAAVSQIAQLHDVSTFPYPLIYLSDADREALNAQWLTLGDFAENGLVWFVTGDRELNDEAWAAYISQLHEKGMDDIISIFADALNK